MRSLRRLVRPGFATIFFASFLVVASPAVAHGGCSPSDTFSAEGGQQVHLTAKWSCTEAHYKMWVKAFVQHKLSPASSWINAGYTDVKIKLETKFVVADPGSIQCFVSNRRPDTTGASWRIVIDYARVYNSALSEADPLPGHSTEQWIGPAHFYPCF